MKSKPLIAITLGDPAGIGPEIIVGAGPKPSSTNGAGRWWWDIRACSAGPSSFGRPTCTCRRSSRRTRPNPPRRHPLHACGSDDVLEVAPGRLDARAGQAAYDAVVAAAQLALDGKVDAITTAPLHKEALHRAGHAYPGHTELLANCAASRTSP